MNALKPAEKRISMRFDKVFPVVIRSELHGETRAIARNVSEGGMLVEMIDPLPLGAAVTVHFTISESACEFVAEAEVKHQYCYNYSIEDEPSRARGIGLRFTSFSEQSESSLSQLLGPRRLAH